MKRWIPNPCEECEEHGASVEILTDAEQTIPNGACANDGDECRCSEGCRGWMTADGDAFYCNWHDDANNVLSVSLTHSKEASA
jgi:hypothetical protein